MKDKYMKSFKDGIYFSKGCIRIQVKKNAMIDIGILLQNLFPPSISFVGKKSIYAIELTDDLTA